jgi:hypothetical protein
MATRMTFTTPLTSGRDIRAALRRVGFSTKLITRKGDQIVVETEAEGREHLLQFEHKMAVAGFTLQGSGFKEGS